MSKPKTYLFHEISSYLPLLEGEEFDALVDDIRQFGQIEPAVLFKGKIIDGRNRYRACKQLGIALKTREWKPSEATGMTPLQFVISENIMRRHLNTAQKSEVGLLLLEEEEKLAKERLSKIVKAKANIQSIKGKRDFQKITDKNQKELLAQEIKKIQDEMGSGSSAEKVGKQVRVGRSTITKAKKIKEVAKEDKEIAEDWEKAKRGEIGVDKVYQEVQKKEIIETLPEPLKKKAIKQKISSDEARKLVKTMKVIEETAPELTEMILKPETKITEEKLEEIQEIAKLPEDIRKEVVKEEITIKDAKDIAEIPKPELRKEAIKFVKKQKKEQEMTKEYIMDVAKGKEKMPTKTLDLDMKIINQFTQIYKQVVMKMTKRLVDSYSEQIKVRLLKIMKEILIHLQKELNIGGAIIEVEKS